MDREVGRELVERLPRFFLSWDSPVSIRSSQPIGSLSFQRPQVRPRDALTKTMVHLGETFAPVRADLVFRPAVERVLFTSTVRSAGRRRPEPLPALCRPAVEDVYPVIVTPARSCR